ncbi:MAG: Ig-like domain-containing protein [Actinomycetota bacterium]|nr:Ig-like domain-containing protein [Actinomycetota bacterium]
MLDQHTAGSDRVLGDLDAGDGAGADGHDTTISGGGRLRPVLLGVAIACILVAAAGAASWRIWHPFDLGAPTPPPPRVSLSLSPADGAVDVRLDAPVDVSATLGQLDGVTVTAASGAATPASSTEPAPDPANGPPELAGAGDTQHWRAALPLEPATTYTVAATVIDVRGRREVRRSSFTTLTPTKVLKVSIAPLNGQTVGVGMPLALYLNTAVTDHAAFESHLGVATTPGVAGAWHWFSDTELHFRPENYWPPDTKISLEADLAAFDNGDGVWAVTPRNMSFSIGASRVSTVDAGTHQMTVTEGNTVLRTMNVSTGRDKYPTDSGIHVASEKARSIIMDSSTVGIPRGSADGYYETVEFNVRISNSGEFIHSAPWSVADQGQNNVSHGCVNLAPADAEWFYNFTVPGDVVKVVGTPKQLAPTNGLGDWNIAWSEWDN